MNRHQFILKRSKIRQVQIAIVASLAVLVGLIVVISRAAGVPLAFEAETGTRSAPATVVASSSASGGSVLKFGAAATPTPTPAPTATPVAGGGGICSTPFAQTSVARGDINIGTNGIFQVRNEAWSDSHGPQTIYACSEQSWYVMSNQPDMGGAVQTYPDSLYWVNGTQQRTINNYTSITSTFAEAYQPQGNWNASYDIWLNNFSKEVMIWNEWNGGPGYWADRSKTSVGKALTLNGVPYHFAQNGTILQFFRDTQVKSGSVDVLAALKWLQTNGYLTTTDKLTQIEYGVEICSTVGTQRFDTTGFTVNIQ